MEDTSFAKIVNRTIIYFSQQKESPTLSLLDVVFCAVKVFGEFCESMKGFARGCTCEHTSRWFWCREAGCKAHSLSPADPNCSPRSTALLLLRVQTTSPHSPLSPLSLSAAWHNSPVPPWGNLRCRQICLIYAGGTVLQVFNDHL